MKLENRVIAISGATGGLGRVVSKTFAAQGAKLALFGRTLEKLTRLVSELDLDQDKTLLHPLNVSDPKATTAAAEAVRQQFGKIDGYLHLVGGWTGGKSTIEVSADEMENMLSQHLWSSFHMAQAFIPPMVDNQWGRFAVISSPSAQHPPGNNSPYAIGKAALEALTLSLAEELKGTGVTANIVTVRMIDTKHERVNNPSEKNMSWTLPEEIAETLVHLCSEAGGTINGARIPLFGGGW